MTNLYASNATDVEAKDHNAQVPKSLMTVFEHLLSQSEQASPQKPNMEQIEKIIDFVNSQKDLSKVYSMGKRKGASSGYYEFELNRSLKEVLNLIYNPEIPSYVFLPASVRRSEWIEVDGKRQKLPKLANYLNDLSNPVVIKGVEYIENTPDTYSGAYYSYELDRALLLTRHNGHRVLISISLQRDKSEVGKKGLVLGSDDNWDYLYTGEKGCTRSGLGWVSSYMYDSASIAVYLEEEGPAPRVRCGMFKWLRAGWAGINMVKPRHIRDGVIRFAKPFKDIIESPAVSDTKKLAHKLKQIDKLPEDQLRQKVQRYYLYLKDKHQIQNRTARQWFKRLSGNNGILAKMDPKELRAFLGKALIKHLLGKSPNIDVKFFDQIASNSRMPVSPQFQ